MATVKQQCNIGPKGIARRRRMGYISSIILLVYILAIWYLKLQPGARLLAFIPAFLAALGFLQSWLQFCVRFGWQGKNKLFDNEPVAMQPEMHRRKSQWRAIRVTLYAFIIAAFVTAILYYFPLE